MSDNITVRGFVASEIRSATTPGGVATASFRFGATERRYDRGSSTWVDGNTNWFTVQGYRQLAGNIGCSIKKGQRVIVVGRLKMRSWEKDGRVYHVAEIDAESVGHDLMWGSANFIRSAGTGTQAAAGSGAPGAPGSGGRRRRRTADAGQPGTTTGTRRRRRRRPRDLHRRRERRGRGGGPGNRRTERGRSLNPLAGGAAPLPRDAGSGHHRVAEWPDATRQDRCGTARRPPLQPAGRGLPPRRGAPGRVRLPQPWCSCLSALRLFDAGRRQRSHGLGSRGFSEAHLPQRPGTGTGPRAAGSGSPAPPGRTTDPP